MKNYDSILRGRGFLPVEAAVYMSLQPEGRYQISHRLGHGWECSFWYRGTASTTGEHLWTRGSGTLRDALAYFDGKAAAV